MLILSVKAVHPEAKFFKRQNFADRFLVFFLYNVNTPLRCDRGELWNFDTGFTVITKGAFVSHHTTDPRGMLYSIY